MYKNILAQSRDRLIRFEKLLSRFQDEKGNEIPTPYESKNFIWCEKGKRAHEGYKFTQEDIKETCKWWCTFCVTTEVELPEASGYEPSLYGIYIKQLQELNDYILTSASTNEPHDITRQEMFINCYTTPEIADKLVNFANENKCKYSKHDGKTIEHTYINNNKQITDEKKIRKFCYKHNRTMVRGECFPGYFSKEEEDFIYNNLVFVTIEDPDIKNRDLYEKLLNYLKV